jgi:exonuclease SbcD
VQELLPNALEVRIDPDMIPSLASDRMAQRAGRSPRELFGDYLDSRGTVEDGVRELFDDLYDEVSSN